MGAVGTSRHEEDLDHAPSPHGAECSVEETAACLALRPETVKTRLHRARRLLRAALHDTLATSMTDAFPFLGARCDRMTNAVLARLDVHD